MTTITNQIKINAPKEKVWDILADFSAIQNFHPGVPKSFATSDATTGLGATRHCDLLPTGGIEERIVEWNEGRDYKVEIYKGKGVPPFKTAIGHISVKPDGNGSIATMSLAYQLKFGPLGALMDALLVKKQFQKAVPGILAGLKLHSETGSLVDAKTPIELSLVTA